MKRIILTGATGLFGINFFSNNTEFEIIPIINKKIINLKKSIKVNLLNSKKLKSIIKETKPEVILHAAALTDIEKCEKNKKLANDINIKITKNLIDCSKYYKCKLVFISTDHLFSKKKNYFFENDITDPLNHYAKTKNKSEKLIKKNLSNYLIIRTNFFGWGTKYRKSFSDQIIENLRKKKIVSLFDDVYFNPINVNVLSRVITDLILKNFKGTFNVSSNSSISKYKFGLLLSKEFNLDRNFIKPIRLADIKITKRPNYMSLSNNKLIKTLKISLNELSISKQIKNLKKTKDKKLRLLK